MKIKAVLGAGTSHAAHGGPADSSMPIPPSDAALAAAALNSSLHRYDILLLIVSMHAIRIMHSVLVCIPEFERSFRHARAASHRHSCVATYQTRDYHTGGAQQLLGMGASSLTGPSQTGRAVTQQQQTLQMAASLVMLLMVLIMQLQ